MLKRYEIFQPTPNTVVELKNQSMCNQSATELHRQGNRELCQKAELV